MIKELLYIFVKRHKPWVKIILLTELSLLHYSIKKHVFLWSKLRIGRFINDGLWPIRVKTNLFGGFHSWREYVSYPIIWNCEETKGYVFGVAFGCLIYCLPTGFTWIWILPTSSVFFLTKSVVGTLRHFI